MKVSVTITRSYMKTVTIDIDDAKVPTHGHMLYEAEQQAYGVRWSNDDPDVISDINVSDIIPVDGEE